MSKPPVIIGNWKMNLTIKEAKEFISALPKMLSPAVGKVCLSVPYTLLSVAVEQARGTEIEVGAQNISEYENGAYTGEVSTSMVQDAGGMFTLVGHSERRTLFHEKDDVVHSKVMRAILGGVNPVVCVGETQDEKQASKTQEVLLRQLEKAIGSLNQHELSVVTIAYEPVWAIGTGNAATPEDAQTVHQIIRQYLKSKWGESLASQTPILYGGSVNPATIVDLIKMNDIDGALVGGASLDVHSFSEIVNIARETKS